MVAHTGSAALWDCCIIAAVNHAAFHDEAYALELLGIFQWSPGVATTSA